MNKQAEKLTQLLAENAISEEEFANCLGIEYSVAVDLCSGQKRLSKALAKQIEQTFSKPAQWLDVETEIDSKGPNYDLFG